MKFIIVSVFALFWFWGSLKEYEYLATWLELLFFVFVFDFFDGKERKKKREQDIKMKIKKLTKYVMNETGLVLSQQQATFFKKTNDKIMPELVKKVTEKIAQEASGKCYENMRKLIEGIFKTNDKTMQESVEKVTKKITQEASEENEIIPSGFIYYVICYVFCCYIFYYGRYIDETNINGKRKLLIKSFIEEKERIKNDPEDDFLYPSSTEELRQEFKNDRAIEKTYDKIFRRKPCKDL